MYCFFMLTFLYITQFHVFFPTISRGKKSYHFSSSQTLCHLFSPAPLSPGDSKVSCHNQVKHEQGLFKVTHEVVLWLSLVTSAHSEVTNDQYLAKARVDKYCCQHCSSARWRNSVHAKWMCLRWSWCAGWTTQCPRQPRSPRRPVPPPRQGTGPRPRPQLARLQVI